MTSWRPSAATTRAIVLATAGAVGIAVWSTDADVPPAPMAAESAAGAPHSFASPARVAAEPDLPEHYQHSIGGLASPGGFTLPQRLAATADGELLLTDAASHRVQVHAPSGSLLAAWGAFGTAEGRFSLPDGVAAGSDGRVFVADRANGRVQVFDSAARLVDVWREYPDPERPERARPIRPTDVAAAPGGDVLVADWYDNRVLRFDATGSFVGSWGASGNEPGRFVGLTAIAVGADGRVFTAEWGTDRVQVFDLQGSLLEVWRPGQATDVAAHGGHVYVAGGKLFGVRRLDHAGAMIGEIPLAGAGGPPAPGGLSSARSVAVDEGGAVFVLEANAGGRADRVVRFTSELSYTSEWSGGAPSDGLIQPADVTLDLKGRVLVADPTHAQVQRFHGDGRHESTWDASREPRLDMREPSSIAVGADGDVYVSDRVAGRVLRLDDAGRLQHVIGAGDGGDPGEFGDQGPGDLAFTHPASSQPLLLYVADAGNSRVQAFDRDGVSLLQFGQEGAGPGDFCGGCVGHVATTPGGPVFVTERSALQRVLAHSWSGEHRFTFEGRVGEDSRFAPLTGIAFGPPDRLYLADPRMRIQMFTTEGRHLGDWDTSNARVGTRIEPAAVAADSSGLVYVADAYGGMVHVFGPKRPRDWRVELFDNAWVAGAPTAVDRAARPELQWGDEPPAPGLPADGVSARMAGELVFPAGRSRLEVEVEGGCRVWVGEQLVIDEWVPQATTHSHVFIEAPEDPRAVVEFVDVSGPAKAIVRVTAGDGTLTPPTPRTPATPGTPGTPPTPGTPETQIASTFLPRLDVNR